MKYAHITIPLIAPLQQRLDKTGSSSRIMSLASLWGFGFSSEGGMFCCAASSPAVLNGWFLVGRVWNSKLPTMSILCLSVILPRVGKLSISFGFKSPTLSPLLFSCFTRLACHFLTLHCHPSRNYLPVWFP